MHTSRENPSVCPHHHLSQSWKIANRARSRVYSCDLHEMHQLPSRRHSSENFYFLVGNKKNLLTSISQLKPLPNEPGRPSMLGMLQNDSVWSESWGDLDLPATLLYIWHKDVISTLEVSRQTKRSLLVLFQYKDIAVLRWVRLAVVSDRYFSDVRVRSRSFKSRLWQ